MITDEELDALPPGDPSGMWAACASLPGDRFLALLSANTSCDPLRPSWVTVWHCQKGDHPTAAEAIECAARHRADLKEAWSKRMESAEASSLGLEPDGTSIGELREAIVEAMDLNGAFGVNLHESKDVLLRAGDVYRHLRQISVGFVNGRLVFILEAGAEDR